MTDFLSSFIKTEKRDKKGFREFKKIVISLGPTEELLNYSYGEVEKPETLNYRNFKPETGGLFCEKIFGPTRDWKCYCGRYNGKKFAGVTCERCKVEVASRNVRRVRMGHIKLYAPVVHIWFFKSVPSVIATLLDIKSKNLEKVIYYENYIVISPGKALLKPGRIVEKSIIDKLLVKNEEKIKYLSGTKVLEWLKEEKMIPQIHFMEFKKILGKDIEIIDNKMLEKITKNKDYLPLCEKVIGKLDAAGYRIQIDDIGKILTGKLILIEKIDKEVGLYKGKLLSNEDLKFYENVFSNEFEVKTGAEAIEDLLKRLNLKVMYEKSKNSLLKSRKLVKKFRTSFNKLKSVKQICEKLSIAEKDLKEIISYKSFVVTKSFENKLKISQIISEDEYYEYLDKYGEAIQVADGMDAVKFLTARLKLDEDKKFEKLLKQFESKVYNRIMPAPSQTERKIIKKIEIIQGFIRSGTSPEYMILKILPVIPPDLRPMVPLEGGRFATSDLNDIYRRVINRNNRLKKLVEMHTPDLIIRNEKRMLQEAVDSLIDNQKTKKPIKGSNNRPLKSLTELLKGKTGRFRQNLLGKRVDYSGRSVIVVGPELKLNQCGLPKKMALELFKPFVCERLISKKLANGIRSAKQLIEKETPEVWDALEEVIEGHPVLLNRAPTLHRLSIQAFEPVLVEGYAIRLHPLVCVGYNADFDGDQMAVHVPLSRASQIECRILMLATNNLLLPSSGQPVMTPTQDMIIGLSYLTKDTLNYKGQKINKVFANIDELFIAIERQLIDIHYKIAIKYKGEVRITTPGKILFNEAFPKDYEFINKFITKKGIGAIIKKVYAEYGIYETVKTLDQLKFLGFHYATIMGCSIGIDDIKIPEIKQKLIEQTEKKVDKLRKKATTEDFYNQTINLWQNVTKKLEEEVGKSIAVDQNGFNPLYMMVKSGARGNMDQVRQLAGLRGLMAKPSGEIIELPIKSNFREGLTVSEYFVSTHGARKGLADTALKTADAGYLTRRLVDVAQSIIISEYDCGTKNYILVSDLIYEGTLLKTVSERILGQIAAKDVVDPRTGNILVEEGKEISEEIAQKIAEAGIDKVAARSPLTCETVDGICAKCYGRNLATGRLADLGETAGILAAQSIGEPGTQLTMRTFHIGGIAMGETVKDITAETDYIAEEFPEKDTKMQAIRTEQNEKAYVVLRETKIILREIKETIELEKGIQPTVFDGLWVYKGDTVAIKKDKNKDKVIKAPIEGMIRIDKNNLYIVGKENHIWLTAGSIVKIDVGDIVKEDELIAETDPFNDLLIAQTSGKIKLYDIEKGRTVKQEIDPNTGLLISVIVEDKQKQLYPYLTIGKEEYDLPYGAILEIEDNQPVKKGDIIAKIPKESTRTKDITGGLPRVEDLFEARKREKNKAYVAEISGRVIFKPREKKTYRIIEILDEETENRKEYRIPAGKYIKVRHNDMVEAGRALTDGYINPQDILRIKGVLEVQEYLLREVQAVYGLQGVGIHDKHIQIMIRQMLKRVEITDPGDSGLLPGKYYNQYMLNKLNKKLIEEGKTPAASRTVLLGISKAALETDSWLSAASFQETKKILTFAAVTKSEDNLNGLKENVIIGHLVPSGTGFKQFRNIKSQDLNDIFNKVDQVVKESAEDIFKTDEDLELEKQQLAEEAEKE